MGMIIVWLMMSCTMVCYAQTSTYQFRTTSSYHAAQQSSSVHRTQYTVHSTSTPIHSTQYTYEFRSTSVYLPAEAADGSSRVYAPGAGRPRRGSTNPWGEEDASGEADPTGEGIGEVADPTPIGSPLILLFFAAVYMLIRFVRSRSASQLAQ